MFKTLKRKKVILTLLALVIMVFSFSPDLYAASYKVTGSTSLNPGGSTTITVTGTGLSGRFNISSSNPAVVSISKDRVFVDNSSDTLTATAKAAGTAIITISPHPENVAESVNGDDISKTIGSKTLTITVKAPVVEQPTQPSTPSTPTTTKSSNAKLKRLVPDFEGLSPNFNPDVIKYTLIVPSTADSLNLSIQVAENGAKYWVTGDDNLKLGDNTVTVTVTAPDGTKKTYTIIVTKAADVKKANALLSSIIVDGKTLSPVFASETLEYDIGTVSKDIEEILVLAYAQSEGAKVEITGDKNLVDGENIIKINVTAEDGVTSKEYTIKFVKEAKPVEMPQTVVGIYEEDSLQDPPSKFRVILDTLWAYLKEFWLVLALFAACLIELWEIIHLYKKVKTLEGPKVTLDNVEEDLETDKPRRRGNAVENVSDVINSEEVIENIDNGEDNMQEGVVEDISDELVDDTEEVAQDEEDITDNFEDIIDDEDDK